MKSSFDIVIVTRNRTEALRLSVPLLLAQSREPEKIIIVDSSDDANPVEEIVRENLAKSQIPIKLIRSRPGMCLQRNIGLQEVTADVVFFPDDDSLVLPGALAAMMRIYDLDHEGVVGGVCSAEASTAPDKVFETALSAYRMTPIERMKQKIGSHRYALEHRVAPDPFITYGRSRWDVRKRPDWLERENAVLVEYMTGFRMSFRTKVFRTVRFHEPLGRYALFEDIDASFQVLQTHLLVGARDAKIFHYKDPTRRASGRHLGAIQILNRAYILARHAPRDVQAQKQLNRFSLYKIAQYTSAAGSKFGRERLAGAWAAYRHMTKFQDVKPVDLQKTYLDIQEHCLGSKTPNLI